VRVVLTIAALTAAVWFVAAAPAPEGAEPPAPPAAPDAWIWAESWEVLCPRGPGTSPTPIVAFATPGWLGPVEVTVETARGRHVSVTSARTFAWPEALGALGVGDWCAVTLAGPAGRSAAAAYLRTAPVPEFRPSATMSRARGR
jgi:hypothetical protein